MQFKSEKMMRRLAALAALLAAGGMASAQDQAPPPEKPHERHVFAHYMTCFFNSVEFYKQEIELAQRHGIEGFVLNCGDWLHPDKETGEITRPGNYIPAAERMYQAAKELDTGFKLFFSADVATLRDIEVNIPDMIARFYDHPNQFRLGNRRVLSTWAGSPQGYRDVIEGLKAGGREICFVPMVYPPRHKMTWSYETVREFFDGHPHMDGVFYFGIDDSVNGVLRCNAMGRRVTRRLDKLFMAGVGPGYNSANLRDFQGFRGYGAIWEGIIRDGADWVELFTWNDYGEDSQLMPWRWDWRKGGNKIRGYTRDESFLDVTRYYIQWFRTGLPPAITQDKVYYAYRNRSHWVRKAWNPKREEWVDITMVKDTYMPEQIHDDVRDKVYATTFLTAPAELTIKLGGRAYTFQQPAGVAHVEAPMAAGTPRFRLQRGGETLTSFSGRRQIVDEATQTQLNSWHDGRALNYLWTGGAVVGPVARRIEAASAELLEDAEIVDFGNEKGVRNREVDGSGFKAVLTGLETATYTVRVTYGNPSDHEARLTLYADGSPRGEKDSPYSYPLNLPPTGDGEVATVSFLWSLYNTTTHLMPVWRENDPRIDHPLRSDQGTPVIVAIELIKVEPTPEPERRPVLFPELVEIPGGTFTMGAEARRSGWLSRLRSGGFRAEVDTGAPDERPAHTVTLSPFAIGKYEVTNAEFERFDPTHRQHRDGFSWRDREPVIYVSWFDGVNYCNWLSEQAGLSPSYTIEGRNVTFLPEGEGFRLPSEAEWEYVASGRGEGRRYPWGDDEPVAGHHGNFPGNNHFWPGPDPLVPNPNLPSDTGGGTMVVGTYPAGGSRDGVMDLAGNVCEWVNDWLQPYTAEPKTNPHVWDPPSPYRSIRGSSFGYYGRPLRVTDREFNHPVYGGYIYIGLRIALPEAGMRLLQSP